MKGPAKLAKILWPTTTVDKAREWLSGTNVTSKGAICPVCDKFDKVYRRTISKAAIQDIANLYAYCKEVGSFGYHHYSNFIGKGRVKNLSHSDFEKLWFLGVIDRSDRDADTGSGCYRLTDRGIQFVEGKIAISSMIILHRGSLLGVGGEQKLITDFWPNFNYAELMAS